MDWKSFAAGLGVSISIAFMMLPEMTGHGNQEPKVTSRSQPSPMRVADTSDDEEISLNKNMQPPDHWKWKWESEENVVCDWIPEWGEEVCHTRFERPMARVRKRPDYQPRPHRDPNIIDAHRGMRGPYGGPRQMAYQGY